MTPALFVEFLEQRIGLAVEFGWLHMKPVTEFDIERRGCLDPASGQIHHSVTVMDEQGFLRHDIEQPFGTEMIGDIGKPNAR